LMIKLLSIFIIFFFFSSRRRHTRSKRDWSSDVCSSDLSIISSYSYDILKHCYNASHKKIDVVTIVGGYQAEIFVNNVFQDFDADIIFKGEGENNIQKFCEHYEDRNYAAIEGIIYRGTDKNIYATTGSLCVDIDKIPFPARDLLPEEDVVMTDRLAGTELRMVHMLFSRGCIYNCFY